MPMEEKTREGQYIVMAKGGVCEGVFRERTLLDDTGWLIRVGIQETDISYEVTTAC